MPTLASQLLNIHVTIQRLMPGHALRAREHIWDWRRAACSPSKERALPHKPELHPRKVHTEDLSSTPPPTNHLFLFAELLVQQPWHSPGKTR